MFAGLFFPPDKHTWSDAHYCTHNAEMRHCEATHGQWGRGGVEWSRGVQEATTRERDVTKQTDQTKMNADFFFLRRRSEKKKNIKILLCAPSVDIPLFIFGWKM